MASRPKPTPAPVIAQVITPTTILYELNVFSYKGYVVRRDSRGIGPPQPVYRSSGDTEPYRLDYAAYQDYFHPVFNEVALSRSSVKRDDIEAWLAVPGNDALTHTDYAPLCLRWGENTDGLFVQEYVCPPGRPENQIVCTPFSCWLTGLTYYVPYSDGSRLENELKAQDILREHTEEIGSEGAWHGWYSTDWEALERAYATRGLTPVLAQCIATYVVALHKSEYDIKWVEHYYLESEALARYAQFRENPAYDAWRTQAYPRLIKGTYISLRDMAIDGGRSGEKVLFSCRPTKET